MIQFSKAIPRLLYCSRDGAVLEKMANPRLRLVPLRYGTYPSTSLGPVPRRSGSDGV